MAANLRPAVGHPEQPVDHPEGMYPQGRRLVQWRVQGPVRVQEPVRLGKAGRVGAAEHKLEMFTLTFRSRTSLVHRGALR
jgi:hypothetical protein